MSINRRVCANSETKEHCWHACKEPWYSGPNVVEVAEMCCHCCPPWFRITVPVNELDDLLIKTMDEHPIYNFKLLSPEEHARRILLNH